jgi:hypothetical protein
VHEKSSLFQNCGVIYTIVMGTRDCIGHWPLLIKETSELGVFMLSYRFLQLADTFMTDVKVKKEQNCLCDIQPPEDSTYSGCRNDVYRLTLRSVQNSVGCRFFTIFVAWQNIGLVACKSEFDS